MKLKSWLQEAKQQVSSLDAELIAVSALGFTGRTDIILHWDEQYDFSEADEKVKKRASGIPMAYILGYKEFFGRNFKVNSNVLIPRPETEQIIISALGIIDVEKMEDVSIIDVGTGSGCIPITLKLELNEEGVMAKVAGTDVSAPALEVAEENSNELIVDVKFFRSDLMASIEKLPDIITANLPYVDKSWDWTSPELKYEPALALYAEDDGLIYIKRLIDEVYTMREEENESKTFVEGMNEKPKFLILEADTSQHDIIIEYAKERKFELISRNQFVLTMRY